MREKLKDVLQNLMTKKYTKKETIDTLAWGEKNQDIYIKLVKKYAPKYYQEGATYPIKAFTLLMDLERYYS